MSAPRRTRFRGWLVAGPPTLWLMTFFLAPFAITMRLALSNSAQSLPPYAPLWRGWPELPDFLARLTLDNFATLALDDLYPAAFLASLKLAALATGLTLLVGFPLAYAMARAPRRWRGLLLFLAILPFWTSFLIRVYALLAILRPDGLLDQALQSLRLTDAPLRLLDSDAAVLIGMVYAYLPFMVLPLYAALEKLDRTLIEAASDLGSPRWKSLFTITLPLAWPGVLAGCGLVFIPAIGEFVIPDLLGGPDTLMIGKVLWTEFFSNRDWPLASAIAVALLATLVGPILLFQRFARAGGRA